MLIWCSQVAVGDMVDVKRGAMSDKSGTVKYIFQGFLFLHSRCGALSSLSAPPSSFPQLFSSMATLHSSPLHCGSAV